MVEYLTAIRSEVPSLDSLDQALEAVGKAVDAEEVATLLTLITELYADASCRCEEKEASFGEDSPEVLVCNRNVIKSRDELFEVYSDVIKRLMKG